MFNASENKRLLAIERGKRVKVARTLARMTRKALMDRYDLNVNTLQAWEGGINCLTEKGATKLVTAFQKEGLIITTDWLLHGDADLQPLEEAPAVHDYFSLGDDMRLLQEIEFFKKLNPQGISTLITDDTLEPFFSRGDYVAGILYPTPKWNELIGRFCILHTQDGRVLVRKVFAKNAPHGYVVGGTNAFAQAATFHEVVSLRDAACITRQWYVSRTSR
jgi:transcriptional regulator with XRE-family HTH domain